jgi:hypothetical protein
MGQGGSITLVNGTKYNWIKTNQHSYQMNSWNFPDVIGSGKTATLYVEWDEHIGHKKSDDGGEVKYTLQNCDQSFEVQARAGNGFNLQVYLSNISTDGNPQGSVIRLGWIHDGCVAFVLSGEQGNFTSTNLRTAWMQNNLGVLGDKTLRRLCMPGSHDAGMSIRASGTAFGRECNTLTQSKNILGQLECGIRYFDIRPVIGGGGQFLTGHYGHILGDKTWQGANGESIQSIIDGINSYTAKYKELIVLNLSHSCNTEVGNNSYRPFNQAEWNRLLAQLTDASRGIKGLFVTDATDLTTLTLNTFIRNRSAVIVVINETMDLGDYAQKGFYKTANFPVYDNYSGTEHLDTMTSDQLQKMRTERTTPDSQLFLLSWTLTQSDSTAATCFLPIPQPEPTILQPSPPPPNSIKDLANIANPSLYDKLLPNCNNKCYPNILYIDNVQNSSIAALAMAVNSISNYEKVSALTVNQSLTVDSQLISNNGQYQLVLQTDGNLVLYRFSDQHPLWASNTQGKGAKTATMQADGNFVIYNSNKNPLWSSETKGKGGVTLVLQDDGNLVIYKQDGTTAVWASNTMQSATLTVDQSLAVNSQLISNNGQYQLVLQTDGNLVLYRLSDKHPLWASGTKGKASTTATMQADGNFVIYDSQKHSLWASGTKGKGGVTLVLQDDGNLVIYKQDGKTAVWASNTKQ